MGTVPNHLPPSLPIATSPSFSVDAAGVPTSRTLIESSSITLAGIPGSGMFGWGLSCMTEHIGIVVVERVQSNGDPVRVPPGDVTAAAVSGPNVGSAL